MRRLLFLFLTALAVLVAAHSVTGQKFLPKSIQFKGAPEYSDEELLAAAGLKKGMVLSYADMNACSKRLMDTGVIATMAFKFDGQDLIFTLTPSIDLVPVKVDNLPLVPGMDLDAKLHNQLPLYHGKVPAEGGLTESVRTALEKMLADEGLQATVTATTSADLGTQKVNAVSYSITAPQVAVTIDHVEGVSALNEAKVTAVIDYVSKEPFDALHSADNMERLIEQYYDDQGYAGAKIHVARDGAPSVKSGIIMVPFSLRVEEGRVYTVKSIQAPPGANIPQAEIDRLLSAPAGNQPQGVRVRTIWVTISSRYKEKGYLDCKITPHAVLDDAAGTVSYTVDVDPGPVYHLGFVKFDNVSDDLRKLLIHNWQMMPGDVFNEVYVATFIEKAKDQDPVLRRSLADVKTKYDATADPQTHVVNVVIRLEKP